MANDNVLTKCSGLEVTVIKDGDRQPYAAPAAWINDGKHGLVRVDAKGQKIEAELWNGAAENIAALVDAGATVNIAVSARSGELLYQATDKDGNPWRG